MPARLTLYLSDRPARVHTLQDGGEHFVGREPDCAISIDDVRVSRRHAVLRHGADGWRIADLRSKNGTQVDGAAARPAGLPLQEVSWVSFGGLLARFERLSEEALARQGEAQLRRWQSSMEMQRRLTPSLGLAPLLDRLLESVVQLSATERGFVLLCDARGELSLAAMRGVERDTLLAGEFAGSLGAVQKAIAERRPVATSDALQEPQLQARASIAEHRIRALVCLPLLSLDRLLGVLYADSGEPGKQLTELDVDILEGLASHAALAITVARLDAELAGVVAGLAANVGDGSTLDRLTAELGKLLRPLAPAPAAESR